MEIGRSERYSVQWDGAKAMVDESWSGGRVVDEDDTGRDGGRG